MDFVAETFELIFSLILLCMLYATDVLIASRFDDSSLDLRLSEMLNIKTSPGGGQDCTKKPNPFRLQTSLRARPTKVKSSLEIEQEELEKIPKFKARPPNKKIFESKGALGLFRSNKKPATIPQEFHFAIDERIPQSTRNVVDLFDKLSLHAEPNHEKHVPRNTRPSLFHLHTEERGAEKERKLVLEVKRKQWEEARARVPKANPYPYSTDYPVIPPKPQPKDCTKPNPFRLQTSLCARPTKVKSSLEIEQEELEKIPKFKARLLNKKIFESKGAIGLFSSNKKPATIPQEFHFAIDERIPQSTRNVVDLFDKLSLHAESNYEKDVPRNTRPSPFHLHTEERGAEKERKFVLEVKRKQWEEARARVPKANPYPYSTDYPVIPPKPQPKDCTKPNPFRLQTSLRARPTEIEEEKAVKHLRRTSVPHARRVLSFATPFPPQKYDSICHTKRYCCALSPTSTLTVDMSKLSPAMSPLVSPLRSPMKPVGLSRFSPASRYSDCRLSARGPSTGGLSYKDMVIAKLLESFEGVIKSPAYKIYKMGDPNNKASGL